MKTSKYVIHNDNSIILDAHCMELYIPVEWLSDNLATDAGTFISTFGTVSVVIKNVDNKILDKGILKLPTIINIYPAETERMDIEINGEIQKVLVCRFFKGSVIMDSKIKQDSTNSEKFINLLIRGAVPKIVPYDEVLNIWNKNLSLNGIRLQSPSFVKECIIREVYRNPAAKEQPFALVAGKGKVNMLNYATSNMREICALLSTYTAITYEDMDTMLVHSLNRSKFNKPQTESPLERLIKY